MIHPAELHQGSLVIVHHHGKPQPEAGYYEISEILLSSAICIKHEERQLKLSRPIKVPYNDLQPIPLTKEILQSLFFIPSKEVVDEWMLPVNDNVTIEASPDGLYYKGCIYVKGYWATPDKHFVHELQNSYRDFFHDEMEINLW